MPTFEGVQVTGLRELSRAFSLADKETRLGFKAELAQVADPIRRDEVTLAQARIKNIGPRWSEFRAGVTRTLVYTAPKETGRRTRTNRRLARPNLKELLSARAVEPAFRRNIGQVSAGVERFFENVAHDFNRTGRNS